MCKIEKIKTILFWGAIPLYCGYPAYERINSIESKTIAGLNTSGSYLQSIYTDNVRTPVRSILEIGSRDAIDALKLSEYYKCHVYAFECNPEAIAACKKNVQNNPNVTIVPYAVWNKTGSVSFFPMVDTPGIFYNPGASSCFRVHKSGHHGAYVQNVITVQATRLDEWLKEQEIEQIDMLCIDVQGAALQVLEGMGKYIKDVKYIISEIEHKTIYEGEALYPEVEKFLNNSGLQMYVGCINRFFGDYMFVRNDLVRLWDR